MQKNSKLITFKLIHVLHDRVIFTKSKFYKTQMNFTKIATNEKRVILNHW